MTYSFTLLTMENKTVLKIKLKTKQKHSASAADGPDPTFAVRVTAIDDPFAIGIPRLNLGRWRLGSLLPLSVSSSRRLFTTTSHKLLFNFCDVTFSNTHFTCHLPLPRPDWRNILRPFLFYSSCFLHFLKTWKPPSFLFLFLKNVLLFILNRWWCRIRVHGSFRVLYETKRKNSCHFLLTNWFFS